MVSPKIFTDSVDQTVQDRVRKAPEVTGINVLQFLAGGNALIPQWWSRKRDIELRKFWRQSDHLGGTIWAVQSKMTAIPFKVLPRDLSIKEHAPIAEYYTNLIVNGSEFAEGWIQLYSKWLEDYFTQDNGAFIEIIGRGNPIGPLEGVPITMAYLDSARCRRTGNPEFPVVYESGNGKLYKLHRTRVAIASQMPSGAEQMFSVGFCAVSRCINAAQNLIDIAVFKQEKLGSRPNRQIIITQGGLAPEDLKQAIDDANMEMSNQGLTRFAKTIAAGSVNVPEAAIQVHDLASMDGFSEEDSTVFGIATIALAFGFDVRELFPVSKAASKADAVIQHIKQRGKSPAHTIEVVQRMINRHFLPPYLEMVFDLQDDAEDRQSADINSTRSTTRTRDIEILVTNQRTEREVMMSNGEITEAQFVQLELESGRLEDGVTVEMLFYSKDAEYIDFLGGVDRESIDSVEAGREKMLEVLATSTSKRRKKKARNSLGALEFLLGKLYAEALLEEQRMLEQQGVQPTAGGDDTSFDFERTDNKKPAGVLANSQVSDYYNNQKPENKSEENELIKSTVESIENIFSAKREELKKLAISTAEEIAVEQDERERELIAAVRKEEDDILQERISKEKLALESRIGKEESALDSRIDKEDKASKGRDIKEKKLSLARINHEERISANRIKREKELSDARIKLASEKEDEKKDINETIDVVRDKRGNIKLLESENKMMRVIRDEKGSIISLEKENKDV